MTSEKGNVIGTLAGVSMLFSSHGKRTDTTTSNILKVSQWKSKKWPYYTKFNNSNRFVSAWILVFILLCQVVLVYSSTDLAEITYVWNRKINSNIVIISSFIIFVIRKTTKGSMEIVVVVSSSSDTDILSGPIFYLKIYGKWKSKHNEVMEKSRKRL